MDHHERVADADDQNWVDRFAPSWARPYCRLMRLDRPIGAWLLAIPCFWGLAAATPAGEPPPLSMIALFGAAAILMRGAGCTINDIWDAPYDAQVERTKSRPIPSGQVSRRAALVFFAAQTLIGLALIATTNRLTVALTFGALVLVVLYPTAKRLTGYPQAVLGLTFNFGVLLGFAAHAACVPPAAILLYVGGAFWTFGYDTIYAQQDKHDDAAIGLGSSALSLGEHARLAIGVSYGIALLCIAVAAFLLGVHGFCYIVLILVGARLARQVVETDLDDAQSCLDAFKSNRRVGLLVFYALIAGRYYLDGDAAFSLLG